MKKKMAVTVRGRDKEWSFEFYGDPAHLEAWLADGLDVHIIVAWVPKWVVDIGLAKPWFFFQDVLNFKWPFGGRE